METMRIFAMIIFPLLMIIGGSLGAIITRKQIPLWYSKLNKSKLNPPNWVFGPAWTILYILIGIAGFLVWDINQEISEIHREQWLVYFAQILLNFIWTPVFFYFHQTLLAFLIVLIMDILVFMNIILFNKVQTTASYLLIPYLLWICFASFLNFQVWRLNKGNFTEPLKESKD